MFDLVININCRHLWDIFSLNSVTYVTYYTKLQIMTLYIAYENEPCSLTAEETIGNFFQSRTCLVALETHTLLRFLWSVVCKWPVINVTILNLKITTQNAIVLMKLFELCMFELDLNTNLRHLWGVFLLVRVTYVTFFMKLHIMTL